MTPEAIAEVCHEANRAVTRHLKDVPYQPPWDAATAETRASAISGVNWQIANPDAPPWASHEEWMRFKVAGGWKYGPTRSDVEKIHPSLVPYHQLPEGVKRKDTLFKVIVAALK